MVVDPPFVARRVLKSPVSNVEDSQVRARQIEIFRSMTPTHRLAEGMRMNRMMRELMTVGFRQRHPDWSEVEICRAVADRILHARTG